MMRITYIFAALAWLAAAPLAAEESQPLIVLQISEQTLNRFLNGPVTQDMPVDEIIRDTRVVGNSRTVGTPRLTLVENGGGATFQVTFDGESVARTVGHRFPVVVYSRSRTVFTAEKTIAIEQLGDVVALPTNVDAKTLVTTENITTHRRRLIGRMVLRRAWQVVEGRRAQDTAIAEINAKKRIVEAFDAALQSRIAALEKQMVYRNFVAAIMPADSTPAYRTVTKGGYLTMAVFAEQPPSKTVDIQLPKLTFAEQPIQLWVHQSLVSKDIESTLASIDAVRRLLGWPVMLVASDPSARQRGPNWSLVDEWFLVQLNGV
jgi:hypothetical protein